MEISQIKYPLEEVLRVKADRVEKAEKNVKEKKRLLAIEEEKLKKTEAERDAVLKHYQDKLAEIRHCLDSGTTSEKIIQMKVYLKVVKERLAQEEEKVKAQQKNVDKAKKVVDEAIVELKKRRQEEEKMLLHRKQWLKEQYLEFEREEAKEQDEVGQVLYENHRNKHK